MPTKLPADALTLLTKTSVEVRVFPDARKTQLTKVEKGIIYLDIAAPAQDNKANAEVERFLTKLTGRPARIARGATAKRKVVKFL